MSALDQAAARGLKKLRLRQEAEAARAASEAEMAAAMQAALPVLSAEEDAFLRRVEDAGFRGRGLRVHEDADKKLRDRLRKKLLIYNRPPGEGHKQVTGHHYFTGLTPLGYRYFKEMLDAP